MIDLERIKSFVEGINIFGYSFVKRENFNKAYNNEAERLKLVNERSKLINENVELKSTVDSLKSSGEIVPFDITIGDPTPQKVENRKIYVAEVAGFHKSHLHSKLMFMIHSIHLLLEDEGNSDRQDNMLKGTIYAFREIDRWGQMMTNEQISNEGEDED